MAMFAQLGCEGPQDREGGSFMSLKASPAASCTRRLSVIHESI